MHPDDLLPFYDRLPDDERAQMDIHLQACAECRMALEQWRKIGAAAKHKGLQEAASLPPLMFPEEQKTMTAIVPAKPASRAGLTLWMGIAAALLLCGLIVLLPSSFNGAVLPVLQPPVFDVPITPDNAHRLEKIAELGAGSQYDAELSPDGQTVAVASTFGIVLHSVTDGTKQPFGTYRGRISTIAYSPDGSQLAGFIGSKLTLWEVETGEVVKEFEGDFAQFMAYSPDGQTILTATCAEPANGYGFCQPKQVVLLNIESGEQTPVIDVENHRLEYPTFSPDGSLFAFVTSLNTDNNYRKIEVWRIDQGKAVSQFEIRAYNFSDITISPDNRFLALAGSRITVWDMETEKVIKHGESGAYFNFTVEFSPDSKQILALDHSMFQDLVLRSWNLEDDGMNASLIQPNDPYSTSRSSNFAFSQDRHYLFTNSLWSPLRVWNIENPDAPQLMLTINDYKNNNRELTVVDNTLFVGGWYNLDVWDLDTQQQLISLLTNRIVPEGYLNTVDSNGTVAYLKGERDTTIYRQRLMYWQEGEIRETNVIFDQANAILFDEQDQLLVFTRTNENTNRFVIIRIQDDQEISRVELQIPFKVIGGMNYDLFNIRSAFSPDGRILVTGLCFTQPTGCDNPGLLVFDTSTGELLGTLPLTNGLPFGSPWLTVGIQDGRYQVAATGCLEKVENTSCVLSWDITPLLEGQPAKIIFNRQTESADFFNIHNLKFSPELKMLLISAGDHGGVMLWDAQTGDTITDLTGGFFPTDAAFNGDMTRLATLDEGVITLWGVRR